ncbi:hypothetical protein [Plantibacter sp. YIM 135249]|uniref:hypothetical protein n=1 Tax=Plantibacter sp. YIM 135249 TaxID=3423918 RepID=UPI003D34591C
MQEQDRWPTTTVTHMDNGVLHIDVFRYESIEHTTILEHVSFARVTSWATGGQRSGATHAADVLVPNCQTSQHRDNYGVIARARDDVSSSAALSGQHLINAAKQKIRVEAVAVNVEVRLPADECERWAETAVSRPDHRWAHALPSRVLC